MLNASASKKSNHEEKCWPTALCSKAITASAKSALFFLSTEVVLHIQEGAEKSGTYIHNILFT